MWERPTNRWGLWQAIMDAGVCLLLLKWLHMCLLLGWRSEMPALGVVSALIACAQTVLALFICPLGIRYLWQCLRGRRERSLWRMLPVGFFTLLSLSVVLNIVAGIAGYLLYQVIDR